MVTLSTSTTWRTLSKPPMTPLRLTEMLPSTLKRLLTNGEKVPHQTLVKFSHMDSPKEEPSQTDIPSTSTILRTLSKLLMMLLNQPELPLSTLKRPPMPGGRALPQTLEQFSLFINTELSQTDTTSTTITSRPPFMILTPLLRPLEMLPLTPKRPLMPGEKVQPQTLEQSFLWAKTQLTMTPTVLHSELLNLNLMIIKTNTTVTLSGELMRKKDWMPGEVNHTSPKTLTGSMFHLLFNAILNL